MKKLIAFFLVLTLLAGLSGCAGTTVVVGNCTCPPAGHEEAPAPDQGAENAPTQPSAEGAVKTGLAIVAGIKTTEATAEAEASAEYDVSLVAVLVDDNGVITDCIIDSIGATVTFDASGAVTSGVNANVLTKNELGDDYNMMLYTGGTAAGEWYQQAGALADFAVGKTMEEVKAGIVNGYAQDADLASSATIYLGGYVGAMEAAVANAKHLGASAGDELKLASINAVADDGSLNTDAVALTLSGETITSCYIDSLQATVTVSEDGTIAAGNTLTKHQLGYDYGMVKYQASTMEWFEQANSFCAYVTGKTAAEVAGNADSESTPPAEGTDLAAADTLAIGGFRAQITKACQ